MIPTDSADRPVQIEVTQEMIDAGYAILLASCITDGPLEADKEWVREIYRAMHAVRPGSLGTTYQECSVRGQAKC